MALVLVLVLVSSSAARSSESGEWLSVTIDNDIFLGDDSGYTNGLFFSGFEAFEGDIQDQNNLLLKPLLWTMPTTELVQHQATVFTFGQALSTPNDISLIDPPQDEPPYAALLFYAKSYVQVADDYADKITTTLGIVGPAAIGEPAQSYVHRVTGSELPEGWDTQIGNEVVFSFSRGRLWRNWVSKQGRFDFLSMASAELGTLQTSLDGEILIRYGEGLKSSFATSLLSGNQASNPFAINQGWYVYAGLSAGTRLRHILLDGNTFRDSRSVDYQREYVGFKLGAAYAWTNSALTFAISNNSVLQHLNDDRLDRVTQFGSLTYAWQLDPASTGKRGWIFESEEDRDARRR